MAKIVLLRVLLIAGSLVAAAFVVEAAIRVAVATRTNGGLHSVEPFFTAGKKSNETFALSASRLYTPAVHEDYPIGSRTDSRGFRYHQPRATNSRGYPRVLVAGDSFTFGHGVMPDETYPATLEGALHDQYPDAVVDNAGVPGYGPDQEYLYVKEILASGGAYDTILWTLTVNDPDDANDACLFRKVFGRYRQFPAFFNILYLFVAQSRSRYAVVRDSRSIAALLHGARSLARKMRFTLGCSKRLPEHQSEIVADFLDKLEYFHDELVRYLSEHRPGTKLVYVLAPYKHDFLEMTGGDVRYARSVAQAIDLFMASHGYAYVNASREVARLYRQDREGGTTSRNASGASSDGSANVLFLDEKQFGNASHMRASGNAYFGRAVAEYLKRKESKEK